PGRVTPSAWSRPRACTSCCRGLPEGRSSPAARIFPRALGGSMAPRRRIIRQTKTSRRRPLGLPSCKKRAFLDICVSQGREQTMTILSSRLTAEERAFLQQLLRASAVASHAAADTGGDVHLDSVE